MDDALDKAALAFDADMGRSATPKSSAKADDGPVEVMFGDLGAMEGDEEAGGDDEPLDDNDEPDAGDYVGDDDQPDEGEDGDGQPDDEEGEEGDLDPNLTVKVMVDGEEKEVTVKEALEGYIRTETFHQRLNQINEARQIIQREASQVVEDRKKYMTMLEELQGHMEALVPAEPNWDELYAADPMKARALQKQYEQHKEIVAGLRAKQEQARQEAAAQEAQQTLQYAQAERQKFFSHPMVKGWSDKKVMEKDISSMSRTARTLGFSDEEIATVYDSRMLLVLLKASKYDRMMAAKPKPTQRGGKPIAPGAGSSRTAQKGVVRAQKRLSRTGSIEDAADVFANIISRG